MSKALWGSMGGDPGSSGRPICGERKETAGKETGAILQMASNTT